MVRASLAYNWVCSPYLVHVVYWELMLYIHMCKLTGYLRTWLTVEYFLQIWWQLRAWGHCIFNRDIVVLLLVKGLTAGRGRWWEWILSLHLSEELLPIIMYNIYAMSYDTAYISQFFMVEYYKRIIIRCIVNHSSLQGHNCNIHCMCTSTPTLSCMPDNPPPPHTHGDTKSQEP